MAKKPLEIDMIAGSQLRDTQGEMLSIEGADISELEAGKGRLNDNHGKGFFNSIGRITGAKKIFKSEDCENDRQRYYWDKVKAPFIFVKGYLYDDEDHPNAKAAAAILRNIHKADTPLQLKASVEGGVIARGISDSSLLARTKIHSVAVTFTPANNATLVEPVSLDKSQYDEAADMLLIKSVLHLAETNVPSFRHIVRDASATKVQNNLVKLVEMMKELGVEGDITIPSKRNILEKALESKIQNNISLIAEGVKELRKVEDAPEEHIKDCKGCGTKITTKTGEYIGDQKTLDASIPLYNCPKCKTTVMHTKGQKPLEKGIKGSLAAAGMGAAMALAPSPISKEPTRIPAMEQVQRKPSMEDIVHSTSKQYPLLGAIANIESSGGKNLNHKTMTEGPHNGMTAGGPFGMMPNSAAFIAAKDSQLAQKYPNIVEAAKDVNKNHKQITDALNSNPQLAADFAVSFFNRNKTKTKNEPHLAYSWLNGLKGAWNKYKKGGQKAINEHPYVRQVMQEYAKLKPKKAEQKKPLKKPLKKALMAGYGGGGAPSGRVGGAVIQTESLDQGRPGFKYIACDKCGNEQVQAKHQVKCRSCGANFSLEKLYNTMHGNK